MKKNSKTTKTVWASNGTERRILAALRDWGIIPKDGERWAGNIRWQAVFFIGPAGSGKSYIKIKEYLRHLDFMSIDPDEVKRMHPLYNPKNVHPLHDWSKSITEEQFDHVVNDGTGTPIIVDGTGRNYQKMAQKMEIAKKQGYKTYLVYVYVPLEISVWRNRNRSRFVSEKVLEEQANSIQKSFSYLRSVADKSTVVMNYEKPEQAKALADLKIYPFPWPYRFPPPRPDDKNYGQALTDEEIKTKVEKSERDRLEMEKSVSGPVKDEKRDKAILENLLKKRTGNRVIKKASVELKKIARDLMTEIATF